MLDKIKLTFGVHFVFYKSFNKSKKTIFKAMSSFLLAIMVCTVLLGNSIVQSKNQEFNKEKIKDQGQAISLIEKNFVISNSCRWYTDYWEYSCFERETI